VPIVRRRTFRWLILLGTVFCVVILFTCSGLPMPLWRPLAGLSTGLSADFGMTFPPGTTRIHSARMACHHGGWFYCIELPPGQRDRFLRAITKAADAHAKGTGLGHEVRPLTGHEFQVNPQPGWFENRTGKFLPGLSVRLPDRTQWYFFPYPGNERIYVVRTEP
jgi:hypothetical protein